MPQGVCPEKWVLEHPEVIIDIQREYFKAGSDVVFACTFGANRIKLNEYGLGDRVVEINRTLAQLSREAAGRDKWVAGDIGPTGEFVRPMGDRPFEEFVDIYKEQVKGLLEGGVDFFVIETMMDIQEARAALLAVKESCDLPVCVSMTFNEDGRTLTGTDPATALIILQSLGADVVGCNCSTGPGTMLDIIAAMRPYARIPLMAKPNAGLPRFVDGNTVFDMDAKEFGKYARQFAELGVRMMGGCCGTSPEYIESICFQLEGYEPALIKANEISVVTSARKTVNIGNNRPVIIVGERINPTGKKKLQESLREERLDIVLDLALEQVENGAEILDVNVGMPGINERETIVKVVELLSNRIDVPLCIDSSSPEVIEAALRIYPGRAIINSISAERKKVEKMLPIAAKYGAMFIILPIGEQGVPERAEQRIDLVKYVYEEAKKYGFDKQDLIVDGLVLTVSSNQKAAVETLKVIDWCSREFGCNTIIGLSNVSFGLPERSWINASFLAMAIGKGLTMAIANPSDQMLMNIKRACDVLAANDSNSERYIAHFGEGPVSSGRKTEQEETPVTQQVYDAVVKGSSERIAGLIDMALSQGVDANCLVDDILIPAINYVGDLFEQKKYYLPQLIQSAETMKAAFEKLEPVLKARKAEGQSGKVKMVLATVKGDVHDIGKNIVGLMLRNYGFEVYDIGKDVSADKIIQKAKEVGAEIIGLSALMTTTMVEMGKVIALAKEEGLRCKFIIGGAVVNEQFAREIGADGYAKDAHDAVKLVKRLSG